jgi:signal transduction histidine kinase
MLGTVMSRIPRRQRDRIIFLLPDELPPISVDYAQWVRVLSNLIENALAYTNADTRVCVGASVEEAGTRIWVEDQGPGIPPEEKERIFHKFYRGSTSRGASGTGLGLAIAKEIVRSHGGRIWVEDAEHRGARFVILLPQEGREL